MARRHAVPLANLSAFPENPCTEQHGDCRSAHRPERNARMTTGTRRHPGRPSATPDHRGAGAGGRKKGRGCFRREAPSDDRLSQTRPARLDDYVPGWWPKPSSKGRTSRLYRSLVEEQQLAETADAANWNVPASRFPAFRDIRDTPLPAQRKRCQKRRVRPTGEAPGGAGSGAGTAKDQKPDEGRLHPAISTRTPGLPECCPTTKP